jgi:hypothetical protein
MRCDMGSSPYPGDEMCQHGMKTAQLSIIKELKTVRPAGKVTAAVLWDHKGILFIDMMQQGTKTTATNLNQQFSCCFYIPVCFS